MTKTSFSVCLFGVVTVVVSQADAQNASSVASNNESTVESKAEPVVAHSNLGYRRDSRFELGLRLGYGLPFGHQGSEYGTSSKGLLQRDVVSGIVPLGLDVGYRINPRLLISVYGAYGLGIAGADYATSYNCRSKNASCYLYVVRVGIEGKFRISSGERLKTWAGFGVGYEWFSVSSNAYQSSLDGFELANLQLGSEYELTPRLGLGPCISLSFGQYRNYHRHYVESSIDAEYEYNTTESGKFPGKAWHEWLVLGMRGTFSVD